MKSRVALLLCALAALSACGRSSPVDVAESPLPFTSPQESIAVSPLPTEVATLAVPDPSSGLGAVRGRLVASFPDKRVYLSAEIYLASLRRTEGTSPMPFARLQPDEDPKASFRNERDEFAIMDVEPGTYVLVLHTPVSDHIVMDEEGDFKLIEVQKDQVTDLGEVELR
jgi:hypothetical protein